MREIKGEGDREKMSKLGNERQTVRGEREVKRTEKKKGSKEGDKKEKGEN